MIDTLIDTRLTLIRGAHEYSLNNGTVLFDTPAGPVLYFYLEDDGLGMPPLTRFAERGPAQHGDTDIGFRLDPRTISMIFAVYTPPIGTAAYLEHARSLIIKMFRPSREHLSLRYNRSDGTIRQIDGHFAGGIVFGTQERDPANWFQRFNVDFKMSDPIWYDPTPTEITVENFLWEGGMPVPTPVPFGVGVSTFATSQTIVYDGSWDTYPTIRINGPITDPVLYHEELELTLPFHGTIAGGDYWDILLDSARKQVVDSSGVSMISKLTDPNNLDTFRISADPDVVDGINIITMTGTRITGQTTFVFSFYTRFLGI